MIDREDVTAYFREVHGHLPFPWQIQLAARALAGDWPSAVDAPTGLGKTWAIDVAVLTMADAGLRGHRDVFRRILFVVDRRTVVDEAWEHTRRVARHLAQAVPGSVAHRVADGLRQLVGGPVARSVLSVVRMRGGVTWDSRWVDRPDQPTVVLSTVDQVGSRLLFRGYGVSDSLRPINAALVGCHSLLILDEAHLSPSFESVISAVRDIQQPELPVAGLRVLSLSATPASEVGVLPFDEDAHLADPVARQRLGSDKRLAVLRATPSARLGVMATAVRAIRGRGEARVLVVCNTVAAARAVHTELRRQAIPTELLTGRSRPIDRDVIIGEVLPVLGPADQPSRPPVLVATQTVEVGVNLDVDWLVTDACSRSALVQRLGRVNRFGARQGRCVVISTGADDPVYEAAAPQTIEWLISQGAPLLPSVRDLSGDHSVWLDVSPTALRRMPLPRGADGGRGADLDLPGRLAPLIDASLFSGWAQTSPVPAVDVPVEPYLHGLGMADSTVAVAWRLGGDLEEPRAGERRRLAVPVAAGETIDLPLTAARRWMAGEGADADASDVDGVSLKEGTLRDRGRAAWVVDGLDVEAVPLSQLRPGATLVVPASWGGVDRWGWAPGLSQPALDLADLADRRGRRLFRLDGVGLRGLLQGAGGAGHRSADDDLAWASVQRALDAVAQAAESGERSELAESITTMGWALDTVRGERSHPGVEELIAILRGAARPEGVDSEPASDTAPAVDVHGGVLTVQIGGSVDRGRPDAAAVADEEEGSSSLLGGRVALDRHGGAVADRARNFALGLGLPPDLVATVALAACWHDVGKRDSRFQAWLWGGGRPHSGVPMLAKSGLSPRSTVSRQAARRAGYPPGMRHEALSARLVEQRIALGSVAPDLDHELLVHLVASHHGRSRPLLQTVDDPEPETVTWKVDGAEISVATDIEDDLSSVDGFDRLNRRYGPWGLALVESLVRLADMSCSGEGS